jgi:hypothetical protein
MSSPTEGLTRLLVQINAPGSFATRRTAPCTDLRLYNLLIYEPGQFFVTHQDSEKADDMIGTLVAILPSAFTGGEMVIEHHDQKVTFSGAHGKIALIALQDQSPPTSMVGADTKVAKIGQKSTRTDWSVPPVARGATRDCQLLVND